MAAGFGAFGGAGLAARAFQFGKHSMKYNNVSRRLRRQIGPEKMKGKEFHHWAFRRGGREGPSKRNHPLNLNPLTKRIHRRIHGRWKGLDNFNPITVTWYGMPPWTKVALGAPIVGTGVEAIDKDCGC